MKTIKTKALRFYNKLIMLFLVSLGFAACSNDDDIDDGGDIMLEYGTPQVSYKLKGKVIYNPDKVLSDIQVIIRYENAVIGGDTLYTDKNGEFLFQQYNPGFNGKIKVVFHDVRDQEVVYKSDSTIVDMGKPTGGDGRWNKGEYSAEIIHKLIQKEKDGK